MRYKRPMPSITGTPASFPLALGPTKDKDCHVAQPRPTAAYCRRRRRPRGRRSGVRERTPARRALPAPPVGFRGASGQELVTSAIPSGAIRGSEDNPLHCLEDELGSFSGPLISRWAGTGSPRRRFLGSGDHHQAIPRLHLARLHKGLSRDSH